MNPISLVPQESKHPGNFLFFSFFWHLFDFSDLIKCGRFEKQALKTHENFRALIRRGNNFFSIDKRPIWESSKNLPLKTTFLFQGEEKNQEVWTRKIEEFFGDSIFATKQAT